MTILPVSCPHCQHSRDVDASRVPKARVRVKCQKCGQSFELDGAALHEADAPLELDLPAPAVPVPSPPPEDVPNAADVASLPAPMPLPAATSSDSANSGAWDRLPGWAKWRAVPAVLLAALLGYGWLNCGHRPTAVGLRWSSEGAPLSSASKVLVFLHGFRGSGGDLEWFAEAVVKRARPANVAVVLPDGPFSYWSGRAWETTEPHEREESLRRLSALLAELTRKHGVPPERIVIGGFSQGGAFAADLAQTYPEKLGGAVIVAACGFPAGPMPEMPYLVAHGAADQLCPHDRAQAFVARLKDQGRAVRFVDHKDNHFITEEIQAATAQFLAGAP
ncbi:MAG: alpha/beta fold hydrolase [Myxococcales bacterium]